MAVSEYAEGAFAIVSGTPTEVLSKLEEEKVYGSNRVVGMTRIPNLISGTERSDDLIVMYWTGSRRVLKDLSHWFKFDYLVSGSNFAYVDDEHYTVHDYSRHEDKGTATIVSGHCRGEVVMSGVTGTGVDGTLSGALYLSGGQLTGLHNMWTYMIIENDRGVTSGAATSVVGNDQQGTVAAWVNRDQAVLNSGATVFFYGVSGASSCYAAVEITEGDKLQYTFKNYANQTTIGENYLIVSGSTAVISGTWQHVAVTSDGELIKLYVNGAEETLTLSGTNAGQWFGDLTISGMQYRPFATVVGAYLISGAPFGSMIRPTVWQAYQGRMDNLRIAPYAMSAGQIKELYDNQI